MKYILRQLILPFFLLLGTVSTVFAAPDIMTVDELKPGMQGIAKTVVAGTKLEEFGVEVLGIMKNKGPAGDLILIRTYGDVIDRTGGIAQGMSGSPVYINGKLVGAVAYGWPLADHKVGMVTPIADMLKLWDMPDNYNAKLSADAAPGLDSVATPVMVSGFSEQALAMLKDKLQPLNLVPYAVGDAPAGIEFAPLEPGSAVGVELVSGDVSMGALGTVTYVEGDKVLAFGHPFLKKGNVGYFLTNAYVFTTVQSIESSFKVGTTGEAVGIINQDRGAAVAGQLNKYPSVIPVRMIVKDNVTGKTQDVAVQIVQDEQLAPILAATTMFNVIDKTIDRAGAGTAKVKFEITAKDMPGETISRENMFYSPANIGEAAISEYFEAINMLASNKYNKLDFMDVKVNVTVDEERKTATILEAQAKTTTAKPGEKVDLAIKLKPFRGEPIVRTVTYTIPKGQPEGMMGLEVRGGGMVPLLQLLTKQQGLDEELLMLNQTKNKNKSFEETLKGFVERDHNNDIVVEPINVNDFIDESQLNKPNNAELEDQTKESKIAVQTLAKINTVNDKKKTDKNKTAIATDYVIDGEAQVVINVVKDKSK